MLAINNNIIHLWYAKLGFDHDTDFSQFLNKTEIISTERFKHPQKMRYIESLGRLKLILSYYLDEQPYQINIERHLHGKPFLPDHPNLVFNISHSGHYWILVVSHKCLLGVDIEQCQPRESLSALVNKCFSIEESSYWINLCDNEKTTAFYRIWTAKEAFVKATGRGIALGLAKCVIDTDKGDFFLRLPEVYGQPENWSIEPIEIDTDYACTVVNNLNKKVCVYEMSNTYGSVILTA